MKKHSKRFEKIKKSKVTDKKLTLIEIIDSVKNNSSAKFDESIDVSLKLNIDSNKTDQNIKGIINLPKGTGKKITVAVINND